ncbi:MAG: hypothetical protein Q9190_000302 [Brigantiaea leucoxantha]
MNFNIYTTDKTSPRAFPWLWFVRLLQMVITIIILAVAASSAADFNKISCSVPGKLGYNVAAAVLSFIVLAYLIFSSGMTALFRTLPWFVFGQIALDGFMFVIWIAAAGSPTLSCNDLCNACSGYDQVWLDDLNCYCYSSYLSKRNFSPTPRGLARSLENRAYHGSHYRSGGRSAAKTGLDSIMVALFAFTLAATVIWAVQSRRSAAAASSGPQVAASGPAPTDPAPQPQQTSFPQGQPQPETTYINPEMQQPVFAQQKPAMQETVYPQEQQGEAGEYYSQPQNPHQQTI